PLTASGAHDCPCTISVAIQRMRIVSKTKSPTIEMICPLQSKAKLRLMSKLGLLVEISGLSVEVSGVAELFFIVLLNCAKWTSASASLYWLVKRGVPDKDVIARQRQIYWRKAP